MLEDLAFLAITQLIFSNKTSFRVTCVSSYTSEQVAQTPIMTPSNAT